jgi:hypothetical protein
MSEPILRKLRPFLKPGFVNRIEKKDLQISLVRYSKWVLVTFLVIIFLFYIPVSVENSIVALVEQPKTNLPDPPITNIPKNGNSNLSNDFRNLIITIKETPTFNLDLKSSTPVSEKTEILENQTLFLPIVSKLDVSESHDSNHRFKEFYGINFENGSRKVIIEIHPNSKKINGGRPIRISFLPGDQCEFGDNHACVFSFRYSPNSDVIFLTIHSGVTGEAQQFRHSIEGTGLNQAGFSIEKVKRNLEILQNSEVKLIQGKQEVGGLHISEISRIPSGKVHEYFQVPLEEVLSFLFHQNPQINQSLYTNKPLIVIETCG